MAWFYAANRSSHEWLVYTEGDNVRAMLRTEKPERITERPTFNPSVDRFRRASAFARVDDGWLVGFNQGEFGAALYWFSRDGMNNYKISDHQVVDFFSLTDGMHAIEGLAHLGMSQGSIIRIARSRPQPQWQAKTVVELPFAPYAISVRTDGTMLVALSDSLVSIGKERRVRTLLASAPWGGLYPNSSVLSHDQQKLYIGMRQYVGEFDLPAKRLRFLIPSEQFLNKLPKEDEQRIRAQ
jgi:hypothetical protein